MLSFQGLVILFVRLFLCQEGAHGLDLVRHLVPEVVLLRRILDQVVELANRLLTWLAIPMSESPGPFAVINFQLRWR